MAKLDRNTREDYEASTGLGSLKQYISREDYNDDLIINAMKGFTDPQTRNDANNTMRANMIARSKAVLEYLRDNGYNYEISADRDGQVKATLPDNNNLEIRLLDRDNTRAGRYAGSRIYREGITYYFSPAEYQTTANRQGNMNIDITPEMSVDLLKYALGEQVMRADNTPVGQHDSSARPQTYTSTSNDKSIRTRYNDTLDVFMSIDNGSNEKLFQHTINYETGEAIDPAVEAKKFIDESYDSAVANFTELMKYDAVEYLASKKYQGEFEGEPEFSGEKGFVADMQRRYFEETLDIYEQYPDDEDMRQEQLTDHRLAFQSEVEGLFGNKALNTINGVNVATYMNDSVGTVTNEQNLINAIKTVNRSETETPYEILGDEDDYFCNSFKDRMIDYNPEPVYDKNGQQIYPKNLDPNSEDFDNLSDFWKNIGNTIHQTLSQTGVAVQSINVDENGVIHYEGSTTIGSGRGRNNKPPTQKSFSGDIGQVFEPISEEYDENGEPNLKQGMIETKYASGYNYYIVPGYTAYIVPPDGSDDTRSWAERTRLRSYEQEITRAIRSELHTDISRLSNTQSYIDGASSLNKVYRHVSGEKYPMDFEEAMVEEGKDKTMIRAIVETQQRRVRYDNIYKDETNIVKATNMREDDNYNVLRDNVQEVLGKMPAAKNIFDPVATSTGANQGIVRYLVTDAKVAADGSIIKGEHEYTPLLEHEDFRYAKHNPGDRIVMAVSNVLNQSSTARGVAIAHMSVGGSTQDDAFVVSKELADNYMIRGKDGKMRPLKIGDKFCDLSGNKGVISFIADRNADMSYFEPTPITDDMSESEKEFTEWNNARKEHYGKLVQLYKDNADEGTAYMIVGASYTAPSRFNAGTARELIDSQAEAKDEGKRTVLVVNGEEHIGAIGYGNVVITDMPVDEKTHEYDDEGGRNTSGQLVGALAEHGEMAIIKEMYHNNTPKVTKAREMLLPFGYDINQFGEIHKGYDPHITGCDEEGNVTYEQRNVFSVRDNIKYDENKTYADGVHAVHHKETKATFDKLMNNEGGMMQLPFKITLRSGEETDMLPIVAGKYRNSREVVEGRLTTHEYTQYYKSMWESAYKYVDYEAKLKTLDKESSDYAKVQEAMEKCKADTQSKYGQLTGKIEERYFSGKHNIWKAEVMRNQLPHTGTAVISPDPTLNLNQVAMPKSMAETLGIDKQADPHVVVWRDPVLSGGGVRLFKAHIIETRPGYPGYDPNDPMNSLTGITMHPSSATSFEGDFDGDSVALYGVQTKKALESAKKTISVEANLLNQEYVAKDGKFDFNFQSGLDVAAGIYQDSQKGGTIAEDMAKVRDAANDALKYKKGSPERMEADQKNFKAYNDLVHKAERAAFGTDVISYANAEEHMKSLTGMVKSGAKGSIGKLEVYGRRLGVDAEYDKDTFELIKCIDKGEPDITEEEMAASFTATTAKAFLTGVAGKFLHHGMMQAKGAQGVDECEAIAAANALTHPVTQSVMQLKHDTAEEINRKVAMVSEVAPALWAGHKLSKDANTGEWSVAKNEKGYPIPCKPNEWKKQLVDFYTDKQGLNVDMPNPKYVDVISKVMTDPASGTIVGFDSTKRYSYMGYESPLDKLAYESNMDTIDELASKNTDLFKGIINGNLAPDKIAHNRDERMKQSVDPDYRPDYVPLAAKDTRGDGKILPSVDVTQKLLDEHKDITYISDIPDPVEHTVHRKEHERHLANGRVVQVRATDYNLGHGYDQFTPEEKTQTAERVMTLAEKHKGDYEGFRAECTPADRTFFDLYTKQRAKFAELSPEERSQANPAEYDEFIRGKIAAKKVKEGFDKQVRDGLDMSEVMAASPKIASYDSLSAGEKVSALTSFAEKRANNVLRGDNLAEYSSIERDILKQVGEQYKMKSKAADDPERVAFEQKAANEGRDPYGEFDKVTAVNAAVHKANDEKAYMRLTDEQKYDVAKQVADITQSYPDKSELQSHFNSEQKGFVSRLKEQISAMSDENAQDVKKGTPEFNARFPEATAYNKAYAEVREAKSQNMSPVYSSPQKDASMQQACQEVAQREQQEKQRAAEANMSLHNNDSPRS